MNHPDLIENYPSDFDVILVSEIFIILNESIVYSQVNKRERNFQIDLNHVDRCVNSLRNHPLIRRVIPQRRIDRDIYSTSEKEERQNSSNLNNVISNISICVSALRIFYFTFFRIKGTLE